VDVVLETHEDLASETQIVFAGLSAILLGMCFIPRLLKREEARLFSTSPPIAFLVLYTVGFLFLLNTAHAGDRLVHEFGIQAVVPPCGPSQIVPYTVLDFCQQERALRRCAL